MDAHRLRILVIEDEPLICKVCVRALLADGFEVDFAPNGLEAVKMVENRTYDLFVSDVRTPAMNGIQFYQHLAEKNPAFGARFIFTTGDVMSPEVKTFLSTNDCPFLAKPFVPRDLREIVRTTLERVGLPAETKSSVRST